MSDIANILHICMSVIELETQLSLTANPNFHAGLEHAACTASSCQISGIQVSILFSFRLTISFSYLIAALSTASSFSSRQSSLTSSRRIKRSKWIQPTRTTILPIPTTCQPAPGSCDITSPMDLVWTVNLSTWRRAAEAPV